MMMKILLGGLLAISIPVVALGDARQHTPTSPGCYDSATTQAALDACAQAEALRADQNMLVLYKKLMARVPSPSAARSEIQESQRQWVSYRNAFISAMFSNPDKRKYGSAYPMEASQIRAALTERHLADLDSLLIQYNHGLLCGKVDGQC